MGEGQPNVPHRPETVEYVAVTFAQCLAPTQLWQTNMANEIPYQSSKHAEVAFARVLSQWDLVLFGMTAMVPIAPFTVFGEVSAASHGMAALAFLVGMLAMLLSAVSYAEMSAASRSAGSTYSFIRLGFGEFVGFLGGWLIALDYVLVPALAGILSAIACQYAIPTLSKLGCVIGFVILSTAINIAGIRLTAHANRIIFILAILILLAFFAAGLKALYSSPLSGLTLAPFFRAESFNFSFILPAVSIAALCFLGFDGVSTLSEETKPEAKGVGQAMVVAIIITGVLFSGQAWIAQDLSSGIAPQEPATAFYHIAEQVGGASLKWLIVIAILIVGLSSALTAQVGLSRILYSMARDSILPDSLATLHPITQSPYRSGILVGTVSLAVGLAFVSRVTELIFLVNFGALSAYLLIHAAVIRHYFIRLQSRRFGIHLLAPVFGIILISAILFGMETTAMVLGACWMVGGAALYYRLKRR